MGFRNGTVSLRRYSSQSLPSPSDPYWVNGLKKMAFEEESIDMDEDNTGFVVFDKEFSSEFESQNIVFGHHIVFSFRRDFVKINAAMLNLELKHRSNLHMNENVIKSMSKGALKEMKEDIAREMHQSTPTTTQITEVFINPSRGLVYIGSCSNSVCEMIELAISKAFGIRLSEMTAIGYTRKISENLAERMLEDPDCGFLKENEHANNVDSPEERLGSAFLTWLYHVTLWGDGPWLDSRFSNYGMVVVDMITIAGTAPGVREVSLKGGTHTNSRELKDALLSGKMISKMKIEMVLNDVEETSWSMQLDKSFCNLRTMKVPKSGDPDPTQRLIQRLDLITEPFDLLDGILDYFFDEIYCQSLFLDKYFEHIGK